MASCHLLSPRDKCGHRTGSGNTWPWRSGSTRHQNERLWAPECCGNKKSISAIQLIQPKDPNPRGYGLLLICRSPEFHLGFSARNTLRPAPETGITYAKVVIIKQLRRKHDMQTVPHQTVFAENLTELDPTALSIRCPASQPLKLFIGSEGETPG